MDQSETPQLQREGLSLAGGYVVEHDSAAASTIEKYHYVHVYGLVVVFHKFGNCRRRRILYPAGLSNRYTWCIKYTKESSDCFRHFM